MKRFILIFPFFIFLIINCASTVKSIQHGESITDPDQAGYIYGSCKRPFMGVAGELRSPELKIFIERRDENGKKEKIVLTVKTAKRDEKVSFIFKVKPGNYNLYRISIGNFSKDYDYYFLIKKGLISYMGYIVFDQEVLNVITSSFQIKMTNDEANDRNDLVTNYPELSKLRFEILTFF